ncbi:hypothetical protein EV175_002663, partial [Coemansia sp. RSA 1933]
MTITAAIVGATGTQGGSVLRALHATGKYKLSALTRDVSSPSATKLKTEYPDVKLVEASVDDVESLKKAFKGNDFVFGMTTPVMPWLQDPKAPLPADHEFKQGKNIADAAIASGVKDIIFSSLYSIDKLSDGKYPGSNHFENKDKTEKYIRSKSSEIRSAFIQLGFYMQNAVNFSHISPEDNKTVIFTLPVKPTTKLPFVDAANDTGPVVSYMLDNFDEFAGKTMPVSGGYYEAQEIANAFTKVTGKPSRYVQIPAESLNNEDMEHMFKSYD